MKVQREIAHIKAYDELYKYLKWLLDLEHVSNVKFYHDSEEYRITFDAQVEEQVNKKKPIITPDYYQKMSRRTQNDELSITDKRSHALFGLSSEVGEIMSLFQHEYQGKPVQKEKIIDECSDVCWFLCELLDTYNVDFSEVLQYNIDKLQKRYPLGFDAERSEKRHEQEK